MEALQAIGGGSFLLVSTVLGLRLLFLAWKNRGLPELLMGIAFLCGGTLGALMEVNAQILAETSDRAGLLLAIGKGFGLIGMLANCVFTWWVFRRAERWALGVVVAIMTIQVSGFVGQASSGAFATGQLQAFWFWVEFIGRLASPCWLGLEAALYFAVMRRRVQLGLAEAIVANRFLLWAVASAMGIVFLFTSVPPLYFAQESALIALDLALFAVAGLATAGAYWLAFFPPAAYCRYLERSAA